VKQSHRGVSLQSVLTAAGLAIFLLASPVIGDVLHVSPGGQGTPDIQSAIDAAADGDTVLVAAGVYAGPVDFRGKAVAVEGDGATIFGTGGTVVVCNSEEGPDSRLIGFTITGGSAPFGGGMYIGAESSPTVIDCTFSGNAAGVSGGGMFVGFESHPTVTGCVFIGNTAAEGGGMAVASESHPAVSGCTFTGNASTGDGGGMHNDAESSPAVIGCTFIDNTAGGDGGGMANRLESDPALMSCVFDGNSAVGDGGAVANDSESKPAVTDCTFTDNTAGGDGGAMANRLESSPVLANCVFNGNTAGGDGGAMANRFESSPVVTNCTFVGNDAADAGGGLACFSESSPIVTNCVLWGNSSGAASGTSTPVHAEGESAPDVAYSCVQDGWAGTGNVSADPRLVDALGADGLSGTGDEDLRPGADSPCIDAGDNTAVPPDVVTDVDGNPRFVDAASHPDVGNPDGINPIVDMGAYEAAGGTPASPQGWVLWHHRVSGDYSLWMMNGGSVLSGSGSLETVPSASWQVAGLGDFDGDGNAYDILWRHLLIGNNAIWFMDGRSLRSDSGRIQEMDNMNWAVAATGDFDGDGKSDILWRHQALGKNSLWLMDARTLRPGSGPLPVVPDTDWAVAGAGDFNGDGRSDVLWRHGITGRNSLWLMDGTSVLPETGPLPEVRNLDWMIVGTGDFNGDGRSDILWRHQTLGKNSMWLMDGRSLLGGAGPIQQVLKPAWKVVGTADFDGDGKCDILWRHAVNGNNSVWLMNGPEPRQGTAPTQAVADTDWIVVGTAD
jgi:hypothetical protein